MENIFLTEKQVADKYQVSPRTLHNLRKEGKLENGIQFSIQADRLDINPMNCKNTLKPQH